MGKEVDIKSRGELKTPNAEKKESVEDAVVIEDKAEEVSEGKPLFGDKSKLPGGKEITPKKQLQNHLQSVTNVEAYSVITSDKDGFVSVATTYPEEINNMIYLFHANVLSIHEKSILKSIADIGSDRIRAINKKREEEAKANESKIIKP